MRAPGASGHPGHRRRRGAPHALGHPRDPRGPRRHRAGRRRQARGLRYRGWTHRGLRRVSHLRLRRRRGPSRRRRARPHAEDRRRSAKGRRLFLDRNRGPCTGCHLIRGEDVWPAGSVGPDLSTIGDRGLTDAYLFDMIYDPRHVFPNTTMPPWGAQRRAHAGGDRAPGRLPPDRRRGRRPPRGTPSAIRPRAPRPVGFGDNLDPTNNPAVLRAEAAEELVGAEGAGRARPAPTATPGGPAAAMRGVATRYPRLRGRRSGAS